MAEDKKATWGIRVNAESNAGEAANSVEALLKQIQRSQEAVKSYGSTMSKLRGTSDEVKEASEKLKAAKEAERESISRATLALGKMGLTYGDAAKATKDAAAKAKASAVEQETAAKKAKEAADKNREAADKSAKAWALNLATIGTAVAAAATAIAGVVVSLAKFVVESANALRTMGLFREAATGSASNAKAFGNQIEALAAKVPQSREELNKMAVDMSRAFRGSYVSGQGAVDTFNAVAQASSAMGDAAGSALQGIIDRSKTFGRLGIGLNELQGTGIQFQDVAAQLSKNLGISILEAQMRLRRGRVLVNDGAKAIRQVVEKQFGGINARRMLDMNVIATKFSDRLKGLTKDVNIEPILAGFEKLSQMFDTSTVTGKALKTLITSFGDALGKTFEKALPTVQDVFEKGILYSLRFGIAMLQLNSQLDALFGKDAVWKTGLGIFNVGLMQVKIVFDGILSVVNLLTDALAVLTGVGELAPDSLKKKGNDIKGRLPTLPSGDKDAHQKGFAVGAGFTNGITDAQAGVDKATKGLAKKGRDSFAGALGIHSPSKVFANFGRMTGKGYEEGVDDSSRGATQSVEKLIAMPGGTGAKGSGGASAGTSAKVDVSLVFPNVHDGAGVQKTIAGPEFKAALTKAFEEILRGAGVPTQGAT